MQGEDDRVVASVQVQSHEVVVVALRPRVIPCLQLVGETLVPARVVADRRIVQRHRPEDELFEPAAALFARRSGDCRE